MKKTLLAYTVLMALASTGFAENSRTEKTLSSNTSLDKPIVIYNNWGENFEYSYVNLNGYDLSITHSSDNEKNEAVLNSATGSPFKVRDEMGTGKLSIISNKENGRGLHIVGSGNSIQAKEVFISAKDTGILFGSDSKNDLKIDTKKLTIHAEKGNAVFAYGQLNVTAEAVELKSLNGGGVAIVKNNFGSDESNGSVKIQANELNIDVNSDQWAIGNTAGTVDISVAHKATINGNILCQDVWPGASFSSDASMNLNLSGEDSLLNGTIVDLSNKKGVSLTLSDGATWKPTGFSSEFDESGNSFVSNLVLNDGSIVLSKIDKDVVVKKSLQGNGTIIFDASKSNKLRLAENANNMDASLLILASENADNVTLEQAANLVKRVQGVDDKSAFVEEGMYRGAIMVNQEGTVIQKASSVMQDTLELSSLVPLVMTRILANDVRKRLGDIRSSEETHGVWARYNGGKFSGDSNLENDFTTIQVGIDTIPESDAPRFGIAFAYTKSDADLKRGNAEMDAFSLAFYGTKMYDNGIFIDVIGRMATADTDVTIDSNKQGSTDNVSLSLSGEFGWRFDMTEMLYIEPQAEVTYTYVNADSLSLSSGDNYKFNSVDSLMGRVGFATGIKCPNNFGDIYIRASAIHEFLSDVAVIGGNHKLSVDGEDTWVEFGLGANFNIHKNTYVYADIERTEGAKLDEDWRANIGIRYAF